MHGRSSKGASRFRARVHMTPKKSSNLQLPVDLTTEDEELGTDHRHSMAETTNRPRSQDH
jgi:hypothetical protein